MRLAVVSPFVDRRHGTERAIAELLERLARDYQCEIHLYSQRVEDLAVTAPPSRRNASRGYIYWHKVPRIPGPHLLSFLGWVCLNGLYRKWETWFGSGRCDLLLSPGINCLHPDVVIVHAVFHRLRELQREQEKEKLPHPGASRLRRFHRKLYYGLIANLERRVYSSPRVHLAAVSQRTADLLRHYFSRSDVAVVWNGVDVGAFSSARRLSRRPEARRKRGFAEHECVLLLIGNDWRTKGLPLVLQALARLQDVPLRLLVVGSDVAEPFQSVASRLGIADRCRWESPASDVLDFYAAADVYVSPSREDSFPLPPVEAMACGLPVITSVFAGTAELIRDGIEGFVLCDPDDTKALATQIRQLQEDTALRQRMGAAAENVVRSLTWDRNGAAVWELLRRFVSRDRQPQ